MRKLGPLIVLFLSHLSTLPLYFLSPYSPSLYFLCAPPFIEINDMSSFLKLLLYENDKDRHPGDVFDFAKYQSSSWCQLSNSFCNCTLIARTS